MWNLTIHKGQSTSTAHRVLALHMAVQVLSLTPHMIPQVHPGVISKRKPGVHPELCWVWPHKTELAGMGTADVKQEGPLGP